MENELVDLSQGRIITTKMTAPCGTPARVNFDEVPKYEAQGWKRGWARDEKEAQNKAKAPQKGS